MGLLFEHLFQREQENKRLSSLLACCSGNVSHFFGCRYTSRVPYKIANLY